jgi:asparagine synthase (glutamine-hydrolysing)
MCGIFALLNNDSQISRPFIQQQFMLGQHRGPEFSILLPSILKTELGFHRLAINGLDTISHQPIVIGDIKLICNGEIYNYKRLYEMLCVSPTTNSDCEIIIHLYLRYGIEQTLVMLDGVFSFILTDYRLSNENSRTYVARDPFGVRPLYYLRPIITQNPESSAVYGFASELKMLSKIRDTLEKDDSSKTWKNSFHWSPAKVILSGQEYEICHFKPGTYSLYEITAGVSAKWFPVKEFIPYNTIPHLYKHQNMQQIIENIQYYLIDAVYKRCCTTERPIACLLSGGLDSSLITALVQEYNAMHGLLPIETYSIGLAGSDDLRYAKIVADYLGTKHTEIIVTEDDFLSNIPAVIADIESYDTTTVRASIGNWLLGKYIAKNSDAKVIFNGDGSDELMGGYLYMHQCPDSIEFDRESRRLIRDIHAFDVLRSDKCISSHGLEPRTPFLDRSWVNYYFSIPADRRHHSKHGECEKFLVREAFSEKHFSNHRGEQILPDAILWRTKEAFSDGVSKHSRSLYEIIQEFCDKKMSENEAELGLKPTTESTISDRSLALFSGEKKTIGHLFPDTTEKWYYRSLFENLYPGLGKILPYFWLPRYVDAKDASARTLQIYKERTQEKQS